MKLCEVEMLLLKFIQDRMTPSFLLHDSLINNCSTQNNICDNTSLYPGTMSVVSHTLKNFMVHLLKWSAFLPL